MRSINSQKHLDVFCDMLFIFTTVYIYMVYKLV